MIRRFPHRWVPVLALIAVAAACDDSPTEPALAVAPVTMEAVGDAVQLTAQNAGDALPRWESLNPAVVEVTPAGMAVAKGAGTATVVARLGSRTAEGTVTVMAPVDLEVSDLEVVTDPNGTGMEMRLRNTGGRGYYRLEYWKAAGPGETEHRRIQFDGTDREAPVGLDITFQNFVADENADWVVALSREPQSLEYRRTGCVRLDGGTPCPLPQP